MGKLETPCTVSKRILTQVMVMVCTVIQEGNIYPVHYGSSKKYPQEGCKLWGTYGPSRC